MRSWPLEHRVFSLLAASLTVLFASPAHPDDWGCQVLLCLSNPAGPTAVAPCVPPITRLWAALRKPNPDPFPTCAMASGPNGRSWAELGYSFYDPCPAGTTVLPDGQFAIQGGPVAGPMPVALNPRVPIFSGIGEGQGSAVITSAGRPPKVCVAGFVRETAIAQAGDAFQTNFIRVGVYQRVVTLAAYPSPNLVRVYVEDALTRLVRY